MDPISLVVSLVSMVAGIPAVGPILAKALGFAALLPAVVSALVAIWHALVALITALSTIPGLSGLGSVAKALQADSAVIDADSSTVLSWIERLSAIPVPTASPAVPVPPPPAA